MNSLLPKRDELVPITGDRNTFNDTPFRVDFDLLDFKTKLQIVNDLVRQSILPSTRPEPDTHVEKGIGNCHTASLIAMEYLKYLGVGKNYRYVMARIKPVFAVTDPIALPTAISV